MTISKKLLAYQTEITKRIDARENAATSASLIKARALMLSVSETLMSANYNLDALLMNVHTINTKDHDIALVLSKKKSFLDHQTRAVLATAISLHNANLKLSNLDSVTALINTFVPKTERDKLIVCTKKYLAPSTYATQASQVRNTLCNFNVLRADGDKEFSLNVESDNFKLLAATI